MIDSIMIRAEEHEAHERVAARDRSSQRAAWCNAAESDAFSGDTANPACRGGFCGTLQMEVTHASP